MKQVEEWAGVKIGMWADAVLKLHPNTEWVKDATVRVDVRSKNKKAPDLIVMWHYDGVDLVIERATVDDPLWGKLTAYAVQGIIIRGDTHGYTKQHCQYKSKSHSKKGRKVRRRTGKTG